MDAKQYLVDDFIKAHLTQLMKQEEDLLRQCLDSLLSQKVNLDDYRIALWREPYDYNGNAPQTLSLTLTAVPFHKDSPPHIPHQHTVFANLGNYYQVKFPDAIELGEVQELRPGPNDIELEGIH